MEEHSWTAVVLAFPAFAAGPLVSSAQMLDMLDEGKVAALDVRRTGEDKVVHHDKGHIPGSLAAPMDTPGWMTKRGDVPGMPPDADAFQSLLRGLGVDPGEQVVLIHDASVNSGFNAAHVTRSYCTLKSMGHRNAAILDGGFEAWRAADLGDRAGRPWRLRRAVGHVHDRHSGLEPHSDGAPARRAVALSHLCGALRALARPRILNHKRGETPRTRNSSVSIRISHARPSMFHSAQAPVVAVALAGLAAVAIHIAGILEMRLVWTFLVGGMLGFALYRASFGFTGAWRRFIATGQSRGFRATLAMLATASLLLMPMSTIGGYPPMVAQISLSLMLGAFVFGFGMQLGGACGSGAAYVVGGGSARTLFTLATFVVGSVIGSVHAPFWMAELPRFGALRFTDHLGLGGALALTLAALAGLWALALWRERRMGATTPPAPAPVEGPLLERLLLRPWAPFAGAIAIGALAALALAVSGTMWGITFGYTLWGAQLFETFGADLSTWTFPGDDRAFWAADWAQGALRTSFFQNVSANMNVGLILGAMLAAGLSGGWRPSLRGVSGLSILAALLGGFLMGYGARMSFGCTIGALTNGVASGSLHGWVWMGCAYLGSVLGVRARPAFGLEG